MKLFVIVLLFISILAAGCEQIAEQDSADIAEKQTMGELSDDQLLEQYPDYLDEALQDLDEIE